MSTSYGYCLRCGSPFCDGICVARQNQADYMSYLVRNQQLAAQQQMSGLASKLGMPSANQFQMMQKDYEEREKRIQQSIKEESKKEDDRIRKQKLLLLLVR